MKNGQRYPLVPDRPGWFQPLFEVDPGKSLTLDVEGDNSVRSMIVPAHSFAILCRDPFDPEGGAFGPWDHPTLGDVFLLLANSGCNLQMEILKNEGLIAWNESTSLEMEFETWTEYHGCMVLASPDQWRSIMPQHKDLFDALKPTSKFSVSFQGGLRIGRQNAWIEGFPPMYKVNAFSDKVQVSIIHVETAEEVFQGERAANIFLMFPAVRPGLYEISIKGADSRIAARLISWDEVQPSLPEAPQE